MPEIFSADHEDQSDSLAPSDKKTAHSGRRRPRTDRKTPAPRTRTQEKLTETDDSDSTSETSEQKRSHRHVDDYSEVMRQERPTSNPMFAFAPKPLEIFFDSQDVNEHVILLLRKHPITQLPWILITIVLIFFPLVMSSIGFFEPIPFRFVLATLVFWYMLVIGFITESFLSWFFNVYIITDERVIDVDFLSLIYKNISAAKIDNIEDVTAVTGGAVRSIFNFGTVKVQTAGANTELEFEDVPHPSKVTRLLNELLLEEEREKIEGRVN